jgi:transposase InsO family protein
MPSHCVGGPGKRCPSQRWSTFIRNQAQGIVACDFCVVVTATFRILYVFVVIEHASRRLLHANVTSHPTAEWTLHQLREAILSDHSYRFLIYDRDSTFSQDLDQHIQNLGLKILKTPPKSPQANAICEWIIGTVRRECLDFIIPFTETHVRRLVEWVTH